MVGKFEVIDTLTKFWAASQNGPERTDHSLILLDRGECPMRQMPRYILDAAAGEVEKYSNHQLDGKVITVEVREMSGRGNPTMKGRVVGVVTNGK